MKHSIQPGLPALLLCAAAAMFPLQTAAEDIDIFTGAGGGTGADPKILIILDNTSNWSRQNQQWPGGLTQGQSEARAINTVLGAIGSDAHLGLMEFVTGGNATDTGGFIRFAIKRMTNANKTALSTQLTTIYNNINSPDEKRNANTEYGNLMRDAYNYFSGGSSVSPDAVPADKADPDGYTTNYTRFRSPLSDDNACGRNFIIFIGNPNSNGPAADRAANSSALTGLGGSVSPQIQVPGFTSAVDTIATNLGYSSQCFAGANACTSSAPTSDFADTCAAGAGYDSCSCSSALTTTSLQACAGGTQRYSVLGNTTIAGATTTAPAVISAPTNSGISGCYASSAAAAAAGDHGGMSLPANTTTTSTSGSTVTTTTVTYSNATYAIGASPSTDVAQDCSASVSAPVLGSNQITTSTALTTSCYTGVSTGNTKWTSSSPQDRGSLTCTPPADVVSGNSTTSYTSTCTYAAAAPTSGSGCTGGKNHYTVTQTKTSTPSTVTTTARYKYDVTQTVTASTVVTTSTGATTTQTLLGNTAQCYASCSSAEFAACSSYNGGCTCAAPTDSAGTCASGARYMVTGNITGTVVTPTGSFSTPRTAANADEWTKFMHQNKAKNSQSGTDTINQSITTYTIDVFNKQQNAEETELYMSMARVGGGKYFSATNEAAIVTALSKIFAEIQSVNTTFASASLPVNATNRTQNANQVFIGMFRPDPDANARWFGNLKQYAIGKVGGDLDLVDKNGAAATNALTGFVNDCAASFWTTDSNNYWGSITVNPDPASACAAAVTAGTVYSDLPDGPTVEKGAVAEILRKGNNPGSSPTWTTAGRNMLTLSGSELVPFALGAGGLADAVVNFTLGKDVNNDTGLYHASTNPNQTRPSIHGDVVHSRPLPVNYGNAGVTVYYGANDGTLRAVDASNGKERWAYVAPEFYSRLERLKTNSPAIDYRIPATAGNSPKDYFFDGSIGLYQAAAVGDNPPVWIYPTQRRGGRMVYGFDVSDPSANPTLKWRVGCPNLSNDSGCTAGFSAIGQTWSTPNVAFINGYSTATSNPVVVVGGGYDACEDSNILISTECSAGKGNAIYFIDADTGTLITSFSTLRAVAADVNMIDINNDGLVDYAYAADVGGNVYRIDFVGSPTTLTALPPRASINNTSDNRYWFKHTVARTNQSGQGRKFLFGPGLFPTGTSNFVAIVSGDREHPLLSDYAYNIPAGNKAYVYKDDLTSGPNATPVDLDGDDMLDQTDLDNATCSSRNLLTSTSKKGWFMNLNANGQGEQGVTAAVIVGGMVTFSTNRPLSTSLSCSSRLGEARGYFVNLFNASGAIGNSNNAACGGSRSSTFAGGGLPPSPVIGIVPIDGVPTAVLIGAVQRDGSSSSPIKPDKITPPINQTRTRTYKYIKGDN